MNVDIKNGDSKNLLAAIPSGSVDCLVTDPPYGISFMNKDWDKAVPDIAIWKECLRVMKPGAFAFVMCSPRSDIQAEMVIKLKEAGFDIGFSPIYWVYASGFPKAMNVSKAIDKRFYELAKKALRHFVYQEVFLPLDIPESVYTSFLPDDIDIGEVGYERKITGIDQNFGRADSGIYQKNVDGVNKKVFERYDEPASEEAKKLDGSYAGFQPKPAVEVILVAMKPLSENTYVDQALKNGKGITWLDDGRIPYQSDKDRDSAIFGTQTDIRGNNYNTNRPSEGNIFNRNVLSSEIGRFPANLLVQDNVLDIGIKHSVGHNPNIRTTGYGKFGGGSSERVDYKEDTYINDSGDLSRYFSLDAWYAKNIEELPDYAQRIFPFLYVPKASNSERSEGLNIFEEQTVNDGRKKDIDNPFQRGKTPRRNIHPTVKPLKLMAYLIAIGSRPGDTILDPFMGSGTTGISAKILNRNFIGFEINGKYFELAEERIEAQPNQTVIESYTDDEPATKAME